MIGDISLDRVPDDGRAGTLLGLDNLGEGQRIGHVDKQTMPAVNVVIRRFLGLG